LGSEPNSSGSQTTHGLGHGYREWSVELKARELIRYLWFGHLISAPHAELPNHFPVSYSALLAAGEV